MHASPTTQACNLLTHTPHARIHAKHACHAATNARYACMRGVHCIRECIACVRSVHAWLACLVSVHSCVAFVHSVRACVRGSVCVSGVQACVRFPSFSLTLTRLQPLNPHARHGQT